MRDALAVIMKCACLCVPLLCKRMCVTDVDEKERISVSAVQVQTFHCSLVASRT